MPPPVKQDIRPMLSPRTTDRSTPTPYHQDEILSSTVHVELIAPPVQKVRCLSTCHNKNKRLIVIGSTTESNISTAHLYRRHAYQIRTRDNYTTCADKARS